MARSQRSIDPTARRYQAHADEAASERASASSDAAREAHDRAWAAHFTALNTHRQAGRLADLSTRFRRDAGWHLSRPPHLVTYEEDPRTGEVVTTGEYLTRVADEHEVAHRAALERAEEHHATGVGHSLDGRRIDAPPPSAVPDEARDPQPAAAVVEAPSQAEEEPTQSAVEEETPPPASARGRRG